MVTQKFRLGNTRRRQGVGVLRVGELERAGVGDLAGDALGLCLLQTGPGALVLDSEDGRVAIVVAQARAATAAPRVRPHDRVRDRAVAEAERVADLVGRDLGQLRRIAQEALEPVVEDDVRAERPVERGPVDRRAGRSRRLPPI